MMRMSRGLGGSFGGDGGDEGAGHGARKEGGPVLRGKEYWIQVDNVHRGGVLDRPP